ncbi:uncharacterized protein LOC118736655 [Rhagoletis pomonella]|uniref:uncharacterized protein LOC118736655 n=1 Tax=Rhagoletis pomonella TaxID=28610 RepID=UPI001783E29B|nr:uncharacterized protein LOC118736655 [Rhagoletis pomonella]
MVNSNIYNEDELNPPNWINEEFFKRILDKTESESVKINTLLLSPGTLKNDHYSSVLFRAKLNYALCSKPKEEKTLSFIMKTEPNVDGIKKDKMKQLPLFETEIRMYTKVLPKIEAELRAIGDKTVLSPKLFHYSLQSPQCVVFEDLVADGYSTINNRRGTLEEVKLALLKLAKIHAITFKLAREGDQVVNSFHKHFINTVDIPNFPVLRDGIKLTKEIVRDAPDLEEYLPHIEAAEKFLIPKALDVLNAYTNGKRSGIQVLNHGDVHVKNVMVKNGDSKLRELLLLDYQLSIFGSAAIDLHYVFVMFYSPDMRRDHMDELLYYYITNFQDTLRRVQYRGHIPTITEFRAELQEHRHWGLFLLFTLLIFNYGFVDDSIEVYKLVESDAERRAYYTKSKIVNELRVLLPRFLHLGYFEQ